MLRQQLLLSEVIFYYRSIIIDPYRRLDSTEPP